jgi:hypothetical protein
LFGFLLFFMLLTFSTSAQDTWPAAPNDKSNDGTSVEGDDAAAASLGNSTSIFILMAAGATLYAFYGYKNKQRLNASKE